jgi:hypothetical protein
MLRKLGPGDLITSSPTTTTTRNSQQNVNSETQLESYRVYKQAVHARTFVAGDQQSAQVVRDAGSGQRAL